MRMKKVFAIAFMLLLVSDLCFAASERLTIDNLTYYHYTGSGATVIRASKNGVMQKLEPLEKVTIGGVTYPVEYVGNGGTSTTEPSSFGEYLESAILPSSVKEITGYSFRNCTKLNTLYLPDALTTIGGYAFENCSSLTELVLPANVSAIGRTYAGKAWPAFSGMSSLQRYVNFGTAALDDKVGINTSTDIYIIPDVSVSSKYKECAKYIFSKTITPMLGGAKLDINMNYDDFILRSVTLDGQEIIKNDQGEYIVYSLSPETEYSFVVNIEYKERVYSVNLPFKTRTPTVGISFSKTQTTVTGTASLSEDETLKPQDIHVTYNGTEYFLDDKNQFTVSNLIPDTEYKYNIQAAYSGKLYYNNDRIKTYAITSSVKSEVTPTTIKVMPTYNVGDAEYVNDKVQILNNNIYVDLNSNYLTSLDPETTYTFKHIISIKAGENKTEFEYPYIYQIKTSPLSLDTQNAVATSTTSVRLIAETNAIDETGFGFEWRRIDASDLVPSNRVSTPIIQGMLIGSLRNINSDAYYKYRPYYEATSGNSYYGEWVGFFTGDANVYYEPELITLELRTTPDNEYVAEGIAIEGSDEIIEQGFEYVSVSEVNAPKTKSSNETQRVKTSGMHMIAILPELMPNSDYRLRTYAITSKGTTYGNEVTFKTGAEVGIDNIFSDDTTNNYIIGYYNINGIKKDSPYPGLNIVVYSDGTTRKIIFGSCR